MNKYYLSILMMVALFAGCQRFSELPAPQDTRPSCEEREGTIRIYHQHQSHRLKFSYTSENDDSYKLVMMPFLSPKIELDYHRAHGSTVSMKSKKMTCEETTEFLEDIAPSFPWGQLPGLLHGKGLDSEDWIVLQDHDGLFRLQSRSSDTLIEWDECKKT